MTSTARRGAPQSPPLARGTVLSEQVYDFLRAALISRTIEPGSRLNLEKLGRELHVSNTPLRQALARLEAQGLVAKVAYRGFIASPLLDSTTFRELYDFRLMIEPQLAARVARHRTRDVSVRLQELCSDEEIHRISTRPDGAGALGARDIEFHCVIADAAGNRTVAENLRDIFERMSRFSIYPRPETTAHAWVEHRAVAEAIRSANPDAAAIVMRDHLRSSLGRLNAAIA